MKRPQDYYSKVLKVVELRLLLIKQLELDDEVLLVANRVQAGDRQDVSNNLPCYWFRQHRQESDTPVAIRPATGSYWTNSRPAVAVSPMTDNTDRINIVTIHILIKHFRIA